MLTVLLVIALVVLLVVLGREGNGPQRPRVVEVLDLDDDERTVRSRPYRR
jgi:hypothetical protein